MFKCLKWILFEFDQLSNLFDVDQMRELLKLVVVIAAFKQRNLDREKRETDARFSGRLYEVYQIVIPACSDD